MKLKRLFQLSIFILCLLLTTAVAFADDPNTDDDVADFDGAHTFTKDGEKYGYESYLIVDNVYTQDPTYVGARLYSVTLQDEGKLICEVDSSDIHHMSIEVCSINDQDWEITSDNGVKATVESEALPPGKYTVIFMFTREQNSTLPYEEDIGGKRYFRHYITWKKAPVIQPQSVNISQTSATLEKWSSLELSANVTPADSYYRTVTWSSSDPNVAEVTSGRVYTRAEGTAIITATSADGITKASCTVTVTKTEEERAQEKKAEEKARAEEAAKAEEAARDAEAKEAAAAVISKTSNAKKLVVKKVKAKALKGKKAKISWTKKSGASGYQVQYSTKKSFAKSASKTAKVSGVSKNSVTIKKLKSKKTYYVRVRTYTNVKNTDGETVKVYGKWSKAIKFRAK